MSVFCQTNALRLEDIGEDATFQVMHFLHHRDCLSLSAASRLFCTLARQEELWASFLLSRVEGFSRCTRADLQKVKESFGFASFPQMYRNMHTISFFPLGAALRYMPLGEQDCVGGLLVLRQEPCSEGERLRISSVFPEGVGGFHVPAFRFSLFVDAQGCLRCFLRADYTRSLLVHFCGDAVFVKDENDEETVAELRTVPPLRDEVHSIAPSSSSSSSSSSSTPPASTTTSNSPQDSAISPSSSLRSSLSLLEANLGFFVAPYGGHGMEFVHTHLSSRSLVDSARRGSFLRGLKIIGDPNVPAAKHSFEIDLSDAFSVEELVARDQRPVVQFVINRVRVSSVEDLRPLVSRCFRGHGQINEHPPVWNPRWVGCTFLVYHRREESADGPSFAILWDDEDESFRHMMNFRRAVIKNLC